MNQAKHFFTLFLVTILLCISTNTEAQQFVDLTISIESVEHDFQCCTDAAGIGCGTIWPGIPLWDRPEPRWIFNEKLSSGPSFGPDVLINPNALGLSTNCDANSTITLNTFINSYTGICENIFDLQIQSWENDSGSDNEYDDGSVFGINPDDNPAGPEIFSIDFSLYAEGQNHVVSLAQAQNGYVTNVRFQWNTSATQYSPPIVDAANPAICNGGSVEVAVISPLSATNNEFEWYYDAALTQPHPDSPSSSITITNAPISIYVVEVGVAGCKGNPTIINATVAAPPAAPMAPNVSTCPNGLAIVTATPTVPGNAVVWFVDPAGTIDVSTNYSYTTGAVAPPSQTFYVAEIDVNTGCQSNIIPVVVTTDLVVPPPTAIDYIVCQGETIQLNAISTSGLNGTLVWYGNAGLTNTVFIGSPFTPDPFNTPGLFTFWVVEQFSGCQSDPVEVEITVNSLPLTPLTSDETICAGQTATLTASGAGGDMFWYSDAAGLAQLNTVPSTTYTTSILFSSTTYYVAETNSFGCLSELSPVNVEVLPLPSQPSSSSITVCEGEAATLSATIGETDGLIKWYLNDGTLVQQDVVLPATSSYTVTNPPVGANIYYVAYTDTNGCESALTTVAINVTATPAAPTSIADLTVCEGSEVTINAGVGTFNWYLDIADTSPYSSGQSFTSPTALTATTSFYVSEFVNGCESEKDEVVVTVQAALSAPLVSSNSPVCLGDDLMLNSLDPTNTNYTYTWIGPNGFSSNLENPTFSTTSASLNSGTYTLEVEDTNGCTASSTTIVEVLSTPQGAPLFSNSSVCEGETIELSTSAVAGATYTWIGAGVTGGTVQTATPTYTIFNALLSYSGTYQVSVSTGSGCDPQPSTTTVQVDPIPATPTTTNITACEGDNVVLSATGSGVGTLNYTLAGSSVSPIIGTGLAPGVYDYDVTESIGDCESMSATITVTINAQPDAPITTNITVCEGENVTLSAASSNTISWSENADGTNPVADPNLGSLPQGTYTYYASASNANCTSESVALVVTVNAGLSAAPATANITACEGDNVVLSATGSGVGTLNYTLAGSSVSPIVGTALASGVYNYTVTEVVGACESPSSTITVVINAQPDAPITTNIDVCEGESVILSAVASNPVSWSENADGTNPVADPNLGTSLTQGSYVYYVSASDVNCTSEATALVVTVGGNSYPTPTVIDIVVCEGEPVLLTATGSGAGSISFYDATGALVSPNLGTSLTAGTYTYTATEGDGNCESLVPASITVTVEDNPSIGAITNNSPLCEGETIDIDAPTIANADYAWTGPNGGNLGTDEDLTITNAVKGNHQGLYTLVVTDQNTGCESAPMSTYVEVNTTPDGLVVSNSGVTCVGGTISLTATGFFGATYEWSDPSGTIIATTQNHILDNVVLSDGGTYSLTVNLGNCASATLETVVSVNEGAAVSAGADVQIFQGESIQLLGTGALSYSWSPGDYLSNPSAADPIFSNAPLGVYNYTLTGYGANSCSGTDDVTVTVVPNTELEIVDLFTPNGDGVNDTWTITYLENLKEGYTLRIYARGGVQIMETTNYNNDWDGTLEGNNLPDGTYWYVISAGDGTDYKGAVTLKR
ncbi:MAG: gliding motility-associated-like protein [Maribacter sp.]|jgi:gliding motility-associated-like protein